MPMLGGAVLRLPQAPGVGLVVGHTREHVCLVVVCQRRREDDAHVAVGVGLDRPGATRRPRAGTGEIGGESQNALPGNSSPRRA